MAKRRRALRVRIPRYKYPRYLWRRAIHTEAFKAAKARGVSYSPDDQLEMLVTLYLDEAGLRFHDVDNRLKDIMDALQSRVGGSKARRQLEPIIPNDRQVFKVTVEKILPPKQSHGLGHLIIRKYRKSG